MALVKVTVKFTGAAALDDFGVRLDDDVLEFDDQGEASDDMEPGAHFLTFFAIGPPGTKCKIAITAPESAKWSKPAPIPASGVNGGFKDFEV
jgi:hypothetical protein